jgi:hypothetical protein
VRIEYGWHWWRWLYVTAIAALGYWWVGWPGIVLVFLAAARLEIRRD